MQLFRCFSAGQGSAASSLLFVRAVQLLRCFSARGNRPSGTRWACDTSFCERRTLFLSASSEDNGLCISGPTSEIVTLGQAGPTVILAAQLSLCELHATRRNRFDVSDLFQNRPYWKGAAVAGPFCFKKQTNKRKTTHENLLGDGG